MIPRLYASIDFKEKTYCKNVVGYGMFIILPALPT